MYPWRRILIPTDFSTAAEWVFDDAIRAASSTGAELLILHVRMTHRSNPEALRYPADESVYQYVEQHELDLLQKVVQRSDPSIRTRMLVRKSHDAASEIFHTAETEEVDLIVMATHARHHIAHLIIGSTALSLLSRCTLPVMAIRYGIPKRLSMKRILIPLENGRMSPTAVRCAAEIARHEESVVCVLEAVPKRSSEQTGEATRDARNLLDGIEPEIERVEGRPDKEIVRFADHWDADLVIISPDCSPDGRLSDTAAGIVRHNNAPVLVVPN